MPGKGPTLADVAEAAGVSAMTVSKAINKKPGVADATRQRIQQIAADMGYVPNLAARGLANWRTNLIGVVTHDLTVQYATELLRGIADELSESGHELLISATYQDPSREEVQIRRLAQGLADAIILIAPIFGDETAETIDAVRVPVVVLDPRRVEEVSKRCPVVHVDNYTGSRAATEHLLDLGHQRIGYVGGDSSFDTADARRRGFIDAVSLRLGTKPSDGLMMESGFSQPDGFIAGVELLSRHDRPSAIVASSDVAAFGVIDAARSLGLAVPDDLSVVGFDDIPMAEHVVPSLTTVRQPLHEMGRSAAWLAVLASRDERVPTGGHRFDTELIVRATTLRPAAVSLEPLGQNRG